MRFVHDLHGATDITCSLGTRLQGHPGNKPPEWPGTRADLLILAYSRISDSEESIHIEGDAEKILGALRQACEFLEESIAEDRTTFEAIKANTVQCDKCGWWYDKTKPQWCDCIKEPQR